jgi:hypothetical protein
MLLAQVEREIEGIDNLRVDWEVRHLRQRKWDELGLFLILVFLFILFILFAVKSCRAKDFHPTLPTRTSKLASNIK